MDGRLLNRWMTDKKYTVAQCQNKLNDIMIEWTVLSHALAYQCNFEKNTVKRKL